MSVAPDISELLNKLTQSVDAVCDLDHVADASPILADMRETIDAVRESWQQATQNAEQLSDAQAQALVNSAMIMSELEEAKEELRSAREELERRVERRTAELAIVNDELQTEIFDRQLLEAQLRRAKEEAEAASCAKSEFLANMSHEIRTPMTAILGFAEVLLEGNAIDESCEEGIEAARTIRRNGQYLLEIINDILDLSKIEAGKMAVEKTECSPCELVAEVSSLMRVRADAKGLEFRVEYLGSMPRTIYTDPTRLRQVIINIVGNAIKFTEVGCVCLMVSLIDDDIEPLVQFDVVDTGVGMDRDQIERLFLPFTQADNSTTRRFGGTGLGLAISRRLAQMLGGDIEVVNTKPGVGTTFRITAATGTFDRDDMITDPAAATTIRERPADTRSLMDESLLSGCRVLLVEDGPDNQRLIGHILRKVGASVAIAENGRAGADTAMAAGNAGLEFDIVLMDMQMPVMDGYRATQQLRAANYAGKIIALTAHAMASDREKCLNAGCDDYISKPIDRACLIDVILKHLDHRDQPTQLAQH